MKNKMGSYNCSRPESYAGNCSRCGYEGKGYNLGLQSRESHIGSYHSSKPISLESIPTMSRL